MSKKSKSIIVQKIPTKKIDYGDVKFPFMPHMYLELIENKDKIKQNLVNTEYVPTINVTDNRGVEEVEKMFKKLSYTLSEPDDSDIENFDNYDDDVPETPIKTHQPQETTDTHQEHQESKSIHTTHNNPNTTIKAPKAPQLEDINDTDTYDDNTEDTDTTDTHDDDEVENSSKCSVYSNDTEKYNVSESPQSHDNDHKDDMDTIYKKAEIKRNTPPIQRAQTTMPMSSITSRPMAPMPTIQRAQTTIIDPVAEEFGTNTTNTSSHVDTRPFRQQPMPTRDFRMPQMPKVLTRVDNIEDNDELPQKQEYIDKFDKLRRQHKNAKIPDFSLHSDLNTMKREYEKTRRAVTIESKVEWYKMCLIFCFVFVDYVLGYWLGFEMKGFIQQQIMNIASYEILLIELGEKDYVSEESQWPVELRLVGAIVTNTALFVVGNKMKKYLGGLDIMNLINSLNSAQQPK